MTPRSTTFAIEMQRGRDLFSEPQFLLPRIPSPHLDKGRGRIKRFES